MPLNESDSPSSLRRDELASRCIPANDALHVLLEVSLARAARRRQSEGAFDGSALREVLKEVCAAAKLRGMHAEQVIIAVKEIWSSLPEARDPTRESIDKPALNQLVNMTLDEYYRASSLGS